MRCQMIKKEPVEEWYYKSYLLQHEANLIYGENLKRLKNRVPKSEIKKIAAEIKNSYRNNSGDYYHVIIKKDCH